MASLKIDETVFDKLAEVLKKHKLSEIEYKCGDTKIRISSTNLGASANVSNVECATGEAAVQGSAQKNTSPDDFSQHKGAVKSPMVGTCYMAPEPGARDFISVGDSVQEGQPILIIEAMKVMNLIKAPRSGKILHIAVKNSDPVEFGQLLVVIE